MLRSITCSIVVIAALFVVLGSAAAAPGDITVIGPGAWPKWSPDGQLIAFVADGFLQVTPANGSGPRTRLTEARGRHFVWSSNTELVYSRKSHRRSDTSQFLSVTFERILNVDGKSLGATNIGLPTLLSQPVCKLNAGRTIRYEPVRLPGGTVGYLQDRCAVSADALRLVPLSTGRDSEREIRKHRELIIRQEGNPCPPSWGAVWWVPVSDGGPPAQRLTEDEQFGMMEMAPSGDKLIALSLSRQAWVIMDTAGREINGEFEPQGRDNANGYLRSTAGMKWSPDGTRICYVRSWDDGHTIHDTKLMVSDVTNRSVFELLGSEYGKIPPREHSWAPSGQFVAVATEKSGILIVEVSP